MTSPARPLGVEAVSVQHTPTINAEAVEVVGRCVRTPFDVNEGGGFLIAECVDTDTAERIKKHWDAHDKLVAAAVRVLSKRFIPGVSETSDLGRLADAVAAAGVHWEPQTSPDACELASAALAKVQP